MNKKMRVWWLPQVGIKSVFYIPVTSVEEAKKTLDMLAYYDCFLQNNNIRADYSNAGGVEVWSEEDEEWYNWEYEDDVTYYDDIDSYCDEVSEYKDDLAAFSKALAEQVTFN